MEREQVMWLMISIGVVIALLVGILVVYDQMVIAAGECGNGCKYLGS